MECNKTIMGWMFSEMNELVKLFVKSNYSDNAIILQYYPSLILLTNPCIWMDELRLSYEEYPHYEDGTAEKSWWCIEFL